MRHRILLAAGILLTLLASGKLYAQEEPVKHPWIWRSGHPHGGRVDAIANNGTVAMGLSDADQLLSISTDGEHWRNIAFTSTRRLRGPLHWTGNQWLCFGQADGLSNLNPVLTSPDGKIWTVRAEIPEHPYAVASNGKRTVVVGTRGLLMTSTDGIGWNVWSSQTQSALAAVVWTGTQFVIGGGDSSSAAGGLIRTSPDGIVWATQFPAGMRAVTSLATHGGQLVASSLTSPPSLWHSPDGISWTKATGWSENIWYAAGPRILHTSSEWLSVPTENWDPSLYLRQMVTYRSDAGTGWAGTFQSKALLSLTQFDGTTLAGGLEGFSRLIPVEGGGRRWQPLSREWSDALTSVVWTGQHIVAAGADDYEGLVLVSTDGIEWTRTSSYPVFNDSIVLDMVWTGEQIYAVGYYDGSPIAWRSPDGLTWSSFYSDMPHGAILGVAWNGSRVVMINGSGDIVYSDDGMDWQRTRVGTTPTTSGLPGDTPTTDIGWNGSLWVVSASNGLFTSPDLITWQFSDATNWGSPLFDRVIILGNKAYLPWYEGTAVITGADPVESNIDDWGPSALAADGEQVAAVFGGLPTQGQYNYASGFAAINSESMMTSREDWQEVSFPLNAVCWTGEQFVAVGKGGAILTSGPPRAPRFSTANGQVTLQWDRFSNYDEYTVETSSDLSNWSAAGPPVIGAQQWSAPQSELGDRRFFRVMGR